MDISRRTLLQRIATGAAVGVGLPALTGARLSARAIEPVEGNPPVRPVRLHLSENPYGPSPRVAAALRQDLTGSIKRYPESAAATLQNKVATTHGVGRAQIVLGCGSSELLRMAATAFSGPGRKVVLAHPTCDLMSESARRAGADVIAVALRSDHAHDLDAMLARVDGTVGLVYLCNPNNPTGTLTRRADLERFVARLPPEVYVVVDEAYHHYVGGSSDYASFIDRPVHHPRLIVTRSFSTIHGLAGLRVGYAVTSEETAGALESVRLAGGVNVVAVIAAMNALSDPDHLQAMATRNADDRQEFCNQANARMLRTIDSHANFVLLNTGRAGADMVQHFARHDVLVAGPFSPFDKHVRVSIGAPAEMREFWRVWDLLPPMHHMTM
jgi:histidinol-phosphate aminotransferase